MAKTKPQTNGRAAKAAPIKDGGVKKSLQKPAIKAKELAKTTAAKVSSKEEKKSKKSKKAPTPEPESEESESSVSESDVSEDSESEAEVAPAKANGVKKAAAKADSSDDDSEEDDEDDSDESEDEKPAAKPAKTKAPKVNGTAAKPAAKADSDSEEDDEDDSDESDDDAAPQTNGADADDTSDESDSSEDDDEAPAKGAKVNGAAADEEDDDEDDSDDDSSEEEEEPAPSKKRKADVESTPVAKKTKTDVATPSSGEGVKNLFVGGLSWNIDEEWLAREFEEYGEIVGSRIITDRETGRSKGYGYVEFAEAESAANALEGKHETMIDGRQVRVDFSTPRQPRDETTPRDRSNQRANKFGDQQGNPTDTLFCGNLSFDCTNDAVSEAFGEYGTITSVRLPTDRETGNPKGFGYVSFSTVDEAKAALEALNGEEIAGRRCRLDFAQPRDDNAGGRGGRGGFGDRGGRGRGGFGGRGGGRGGFGDRGGRGRGGARGGSRGGFTTNRGGFGDFKGNKVSFD